MITGEELRQIRRSLPERLSQTSFAELFGVTRSAVADWEGGRLRVPPLVEIVARTLADQPELIARVREWRGLSAPSVSVSAVVTASKAARDEIGADVAAIDQ